MPRLLHEIVDESAARAPDAEAFRFSDSALTYAGLAERSARLAHVLAAEGVRPGDRVGVYLRKGLETAVAVYGILRAGAAFVPLDPKLPPARLGAVLRDAGVGHVVSHDALRAQLLALGAEAPAGLRLVGPEAADLEAAGLETISWAEVDAAPASGPLVTWDAGDMAYLMYTSGSTGLPKGIVHTHASGLAYARCAADVYGLDPRDRISGFAPLHFDQSTFDLFAGPLAGATAVVVPEPHMMMPASLAALIEAERLTVWYSVPYALTQLLLRGALDTRDLTALRWVLYGGEAFPMKHLRALMARWPHARFSNVYGPAEVNQCTVHHLDAPPSPDAEAVPIGPAWPAATCRVLDGEAPAAPGVPGELAVATPTMMEGYWNRPDLNARVFVRLGGDPRLGGERFYRTGDLVREAPDGALWFLGRMDRQVKVRGHRVELDEVEAVLVQHPAVAEAAVYAVDAADGARAVHAAVSLRPEADPPTAADLLAHARAHLPPYALPARLDVAEAFPRTTSGKIDRRALQTEAALPTP
ncbi:MAG: amino acid adenylation domain-containing protein [Bacteroidota bacterium]